MIITKTPVRVFGGEQIFRIFPGNMAVPYYQLHLTNIVMLRVRHLPRF